MTGRRVPALRPALATLTLLAGCGSDVTVARSGLPRNTSPAVAEAERRAVVDANTTFALDLYGALRQDPAQAGRNLFFSPYSISMVLTMTSAGARGTTEAAMLAALRHTLAPERLHPSFDWLDLQITSRGQTSSVKDPPRLRVANSLWGQKTTAFRPEFLDLLAVNYDAGIQLVDFVKEAEGSRQAINNWVSDKTEQKIKDLMGPGSIDADSRLVLVNAIYFKASWLDQFVAASTRPDSFRRLDGGTVPIEMMSRFGAYRYAETDLYQAVDLPYAGAELSMLVVLPREGRFEAFEAALGREGLEALVQRLASTGVQLQMPKFTYRPDGFSLKAPLTQLGMGEAFENSADFSRITEQEVLKIRDCVHKGFIAVDETGTEAAAATGVSVVPVSAPVLPPVVMRIDRPFVFMIRDVSTGTLLFAGRILDPH